MFWFECTMLMVKATMSDYELKQQDRFRRTRSTLVHALNVFTEVAQTRPNKKSITGYILAMLHAKYVRRVAAAVVFCTSALTFSRHSNDVRCAASQRVLYECTDFQQAF